MTRVLAALALMLVACGGAPARPAGVGHDTTSRGAPVELTVRGPEGEWLDVGDLRGKPTVLFLFTTFDGNCQAAVIPLSRIARAHPDVHVVGIAIQPDARELVAAYRDALALTFTVTFDPDGTILGGGSDLGHVESVPTFVVLDGEGRVAGRYVGVASERRLDTMITEARQ